MQLILKKPTIAVHIHAIPSLANAFLSALTPVAEDPPEFPTNVPSSSLRPEIGEPWEGQGGIYAGDMRGDDGTRYGLIVSDLGDLQDMGRATWGPNGERDLSTWDGLDNTKRLGTECPAAKLATTHTADGHADFYLPARRELQLACATVPHIFGTDSYYWSSTPYSEHYAWAVDFEYGGTDNDFRYFEFRVRPVRRFIY